MHALSNINSWFGFFWNGGGVWGRVCFRSDEERINTCRSKRHQQTNSEDQEEGIN